MLINRMGFCNCSPTIFLLFPKNPIIARVFKEIGRADELGSGIRNIYANYRYYSQKEPILEEKDIFKCTIFFDDVVTETHIRPAKSDVGKDVGKELSPTLVLILEILKTSPKATIQELSEQTGLTNRTIERSFFLI